MYHVSNWFRDMRGAGVEQLDELPLPRRREVRIEVGDISAAWRDGGEEFGRRDVGDDHQDVEGHT